MIAIMQKHDADGVVWYARKQGAKMSSVIVLGCMRQNNCIPRMGSALTFG